MTQMRKFRVLLDSFILLLLYRILIHKHCLFELLTWVFCFNPVGSSLPQTFISPRLNCKSSPSNKSCFSSNIFIEKSHPSKLYIELCHIWMCLRLLWKPNCRLEWCHQDSHTGNSWLQLPSQLAIIHRQDMVVKIPGQRCHWSTSGSQRLRSTVPFDRARRAAACRPHHLCPRPAQWKNKRGPWA